MPSLDSGFISLYSIFKKNTSIKRYNIAVKDDVGTGNFSFNDLGSHALNERMVKMLLWAKGGYEIITDNKAFSDYLAKEYCASGARAFDYNFMTDIYDRPLKVSYSKIVPAIKSVTVKKGGNLSGRRIGLDIGASELKICALDNGKNIYSARQPWLPKQNTSYKYHYETILTQLNKAALQFLPETMRVKDNQLEANKLVSGIGVSSAGVIIDNEIKISSIFFKVNKAEYGEARKVLVKVAENFPNAALQSANDGDVAALAGALSHKVNDMLGVSLGTSTAGGILSGGGLNGWLNELAFVPVDVRGCLSGDYTNVGQDEWSGDYGCGVNYLSQDGVIRLAARSGYIFADTLTDSEKMRDFAANASEWQRNEVYKQVGIYVGQGLCLWQQLYGFDTALITGGVAAAGGEILLESAHLQIAAEGLNIKILTNKQNNLGQTEAAATMP